MRHSVPTMIALKYLPPRCRVFRLAYRMHEAGLSNMLEDAQKLHMREAVGYWKIHRECAATGAILATLASGTPGQDPNLSPLIRSQIDETIRVDHSPQAIAI